MGPGASPYRSRSPRHSSRRDAAPTGDIHLPGWLMFLPWTLAGRATAARKSPGQVLVAPPGRPGQGPPSVDPSADCTRQTSRTRSMSASRSRQVCRRWASMHRIGGPSPRLRTAGRVTSKSGKRVRSSSRCRNAQSVSRDCGRHGHAGLVIGQRALGHQEPRQDGEADPQVETHAASPREIAPRCRS